jgi:hypothetical protein
VDNFIRENTIEMDPGIKFRCKLCNKLFKGKEYVKKHIYNKHSEQLQNIENQVSREVIAPLVKADQT